MAKGTLLCPACGARGTARVEGNLCPACLLRLALLDADEAACFPGPAEGSPAGDILAVLDGGEDRTVYLAQRQGTRQLIAVEVLRAAAAAPTTPGTFAARVEALRGLSHPGLAAVVGGWQTPEGDYCVASEYWPGTALERYCWARHVEEAERLAFYVAACRALEHAHAAGVLHGRLGPGAILVTRRDGQMRSVLTGFGVLVADATGNAGDVAALGEILERLFEGLNGPVAETARQAVRATRNGEIASVAALVAALGTQR